MVCMCVCLDLHLNLNTKLDIHIQLEKERETLRPESEQVLPRQRGRNIPGSVNSICKGSEAAGITVFKGLAGM